MHFSNREINRMHVYYIRRNEIPRHGNKSLGPSLVVTPTKSIPIDGSFPSNFPSLYRADLLIRPHRISVRKGKIINRVSRG